MSVLSKLSLIWDFLLLSVLFSGYAYADSEGDIKIDGERLLYKGQNICSIGRAYVHSGWRVFYMHQGEHLHKDYKSGRDANMSWYQYTATDDSFTFKCSQGKDGNTVFIDWYITRNNDAPLKGVYSLIPIELSKEILENAKITSHDGKECLVESVGYKIKFTPTAGGDWAKVNGKGWLGWIRGSWKPREDMKPGEVIHMGIKIELSGEPQGPIPFNSDIVQKVPREIPDAYIASKDECIIIPLPKEMKLGGGKFVLNSKTRLVIADKPIQADNYGPVQLQRELDGIYGVPVEIESSNPASNAAGNILIGEPWKNKAVERKLAELGVSISKDDPGAEGYFLAVTPECVVVAGADERGTYWGVQTLMQLLRKGDKETHLPLVTIKDWPSQSIRGADFFGGRPLPLKSFEDLIDKVFARYKLNTIVLSLDNWYKFPSHPECSPQGVTPEQLEQVLKICQEHHIQVIPEIDCLRSVSTILKVHPELVENANDKSPNACPTNPDLYRFLEELFHDVEKIAETYGGFRYFSIGCDEVVQASFGDCERCKKTGKTPAELFAASITTWHDYWAKRGIKTIVFHDSLATYDSARLTAARKLIPKDMIISFWGYQGGAPCDEFVKEGFTMLGCYQFVSSNAYNDASLWLKYPKCIGTYNLHTVLAPDMLKAALNSPSQFHWNYLDIFASDCTWSPGKRTPQNLPYNMYQLYVDRLAGKPNLAREDKTEKGFSVDISPFLNYDLPKSLANLPRGDVRLDGTVFAIQERGVVLWGPMMGALPEKVVIPVNARAKSLTFLHACVKDENAGNFKGYGSWTKSVGSYKIYLEDSLARAVDLVTTKTIQAVESTPEREVLEPAFVVWQEETSGAKLYSYKWTNPSPDKIIEKIEFVSSRTKAGPMLLAITGLDVIPQ